MGRLQPEAWENLLSQMEREGVSFYLNGRRSRAKEIVKKCCVSEREGKLQEVRYDEVKKWR